MTTDATFNNLILSNSLIAKAVGQLEARLESAIRLLSTLAELTAVPVTAASLGEALDQVLRTIVNHLSEVDS
jgi:hypothetical protein